MPHRPPLRFAAENLPAYPPAFAGLPGAGHLHTASAEAFGVVPGLAGLRRHAAADGPSESLEIEAGDDSGDRLAADLYLPEGGSRNGRPTVVLLHGLGGDARSGYMRSCAADLLEAGLKVVAFNFRGAGRSREACNEHMHPGRTGDVRALLSHLGDETGHDLFSAGVILCGFSLGGSILLKSLATADAGVLEGVRAAVAVSAPLDLAACSRALGRLPNKPYELYLLKKMRDHVLGGPADLSGETTATLKSAGSVWEFDATFTAPRRGFDSVEAYYHEDSADWRLGRIDVPTLLLIADDDPFVPTEDYDRVDWSAYPKLTCRRTQTGGHCGFFCEDGPLYHSRCLIALAELAAA